MAATSLPEGPAARSADAAAARLDVHGLGVVIAGDWPEVVEDVIGDFAWFRAPATSRPGDVEVSVHRRRPDFDRFGALPAAFVTPRNVVYRDGDTSVVDYFGRAVSVVDRRRGTARIEGED